MYSIIYKKNLHIFWNFTESELFCDLILNDYAYCGFF